MPSRQLHVVAPSRLHFGLLSFGNEQVRQFGGVGMMIEEPRLELVISPADRLTAAGPHRERAIEFANRWSEVCNDGNPPRCEIHIQRAPPAHCGLGTGTQLALSVATGLNLFYDRPPQSAAELARTTGRARRSAVGTYGFCQGGLIAEGGRLPDEEIAPLEARIALPEDWRFVLLRPRQESGLAGEEEAAAFAQSPPVPADVTQRLAAIMHTRILPAAAAGHLQEFGESVFDYGRLAGMCFAEQQGGPYNGPRLTRLVDVVREMGVSGVSQSSWGPTLFAVLEDQAAAESFAADLRQRAEGGELDVTITAASNMGACVKTHD